MANFAHDRRSPDRSFSVRLVEQPKRRAFDLIPPLRGQGIEDATQNRATTAPSAPTIDALLAATLAAIEHAAAPTLDEVLDMARRAGVEGAVEDVLRDPAVAALIAERFSIHPADARACQVYYDLNLQLFRTQDSYEGREILLGCDLADRTARATAYSRAEQIIAMLLFNRKVFKDLLIYSAAMSKYREGRIGPVTPNSWRNEIADAFFSLRPGEIFPLPVPSSRGFHVLTVDRIVPGSLRPFALVEREIARILNHESRLAAARRHLSGLLPAPESGPKRCPAPRPDLSVAGGNS